jgi:hypothetical protein
MRHRLALKAQCTYFETVEPFRSKRSWWGYRSRAPSKPVKPLGRIMQYLSLIDFSERLDRLSKRPVQ